MSGSTQQVPIRRDSWQAPAGTRIETLSGCAAQVIEGFRKSSRFWPAVSVNDPGRRVFETGDYGAVNAGGFRVRMTYSEETHLAEIEMKGAGPYFTDLGVDPAMADFKLSLQKCVNRS